MAFEGLDISISGSSGDAKAAIASVKSSVRELGREANDTGDSLEEMGDSASGASARLSALGATAGGSALALSGLGAATVGASSSMTALSVSTGTVTVALTGLAAVAAPLAATLGTVVAAAGGLATAFGAVVGSGLLAFGEKRAEQNAEAVDDIERKIQVIRANVDAEEGLTAAQQREIEQLKEKKEELSEATSATGALAAVASDLKEAITPLVVELGEQFIPLIEDAVDALPTLVENVIDALGPLDRFAATLRDFGELAARAIPAAVSALVDLGRRALPFLRDLVFTVGANASAAFDTFISVTEQVGDDLLSIASAVGGVIPPLTELGVILIEAATPALTTLADAFGSVIESVNAFVQGEQAAAIFDNLSTAASGVVDRVSDLADEFRPFIDDFLDFAASDEPAQIFNAVDDAIKPLIPLLGELAREFQPVIAQFADEAPAAIDAFGTAAEDLLQLGVGISDSVAPALESTVEILGDVAEAFNSLPPGVQKATVAILALGPAITALSSIVGTVTATISGLVAVFGGLSTVAGVVGTALTTLVGILGGPLTIALAAAGAAIVAYETNFLGFRDAVTGAVNKIKSVGAFLFGTGEGTLVGDTKAALNGLRQFVANSFDLQPLVDVFDNTINGIGDAFDRIDFSPLTNALDGISNGVQNLIDSLNELAGVDIDVDVPSFDELLAEARSLVQPEVEERQDRGRGGGGWVGGIHAAARLTPIRVRGTTTRPAVVLTLQTQTRAQAFSERPRAGSSNRQVPPSSTRGNGSSLKHRFQTEGQRQSKAAVVLQLRT
jgi:hypothetical protein